MELLHLRVRLCAGAIAMLAGLPAGCSPGDEDKLAGRRGAPAPAPGDARFTIAATGDFLLHRALIAQARADGDGTADFMPMLGRLKPVISKADLGICHVETPVAPAGGPYTGYPSFSSPPQIITAIAKLGYDTCSTASNHSIDKGAAGVGRTLDRLDEAKVKHAGTARSAAEADKTTVITVNGVRVAHLSYTYGTNDIPEPRGKSWLVNNTLDPDVILADAGKARRRGAHFVIASLHWGTEYQHEPNGQQKSVARRLLNSPGIDLIIGAHAHVVQPFEEINGKWVLYGLGNSVANPSANTPATHEGIIAHFTIERTGKRWSTSPTFLPTLVVGDPIRLLTRTGTDSDENLPGRYQQATRATTKTIRSLGAQIPLYRP